MIWLITSAVFNATVVPRKNSPSNFAAANGLRLQVFTSDKLKIEPWLINGWQSYGMFNSAPGIGMQVQWRPNGAVSLLSNNYYGHDWLGLPDRRRLHTDNSLQVKYFDDPKSSLNRAAFSLTAT